MVLMLSLILLNTIITPVSAEGVKWIDYALEMEEILEEAYEYYEAGDAVTAKEKVNEAYFGYYEKKGIEKTVLSYISGRRAREVEAQFTMIKRRMKKGEDLEIVKTEYDNIVQMLMTDARILDGDAGDDATGSEGNSGGANSSAGVFSISLALIVREGAEAILIVGAILAFLVKAGQKEKMKAVYIGVVLALIASVLMAMLLNKVTSLDGANREIIEGVTMIIAVGMLFYVSNWMQAKSHGKEWGQYIQGKVDDSVKKGGTFSLAFTAFLAVFREGAELILFYQPLLISHADKIDYIWGGFFAGVGVLVIVYLLVRYISLKIPLKQFFITTSVLIYMMAVTFTGSAVFELAAGDLVPLTPITGLPTIELLGIYPYVQTIVPQIIMLLLAVWASSRQYKKWQKAKA